MIDYATQAQNMLNATEDTKFLDEQRICVEKAKVLALLAISQQINYLSIPVTK